MDSLAKKLRLVMRSARIVLWPAIALNTGIIAHYNGANFAQVSFLTVSLCLIASFGFLINDCKDVHVDRSNQSNRLENAGGDELRFVWIGSAVMLLSSLLLASFLGARGTVTMMVIGLGLTFYTFYARQRLILATVLAATLSSTPLWIPSVIFSFPLTVSQIIVIVATVTLLMGREILLDVADIRGDFLGARKTVATVFGWRLALNMSIAMIGFGGVVMFGLLFCLKQASQNFVVCGVAVAIMWLLLPPVLKFKENPESRSLHAAFVSRSRAAMLLLPILWLNT